MCSQTLKVIKLLFWNNSVEWCEKNLHFKQQQTIRTPNSVHSYKRKHLFLHTLYPPGNQNDAWGYIMYFEIKNSHWTGWFLRKWMHFTLWHTGLDFCSHVNDNFELRDIFFLHRWVLMVWQMRHPAFSEITYNTLLGFSWNSSSEAFQATMVWCQFYQLAKGLTKQPLGFQSA